MSRTPLARPPLPGTGAPLSRALLVPVLGIVLCSALTAQTAERTVPAEDWERWPAPEAAGYSTARLKAVQAWIESLDTSAMVVVSGGKLLLEYGDTSHLSYLASVRKSVLAILYGIYVEKGVIRLDRTLEQIGINDDPPLLPLERQATIEHLISARSGVYHPASNPGDSTASAPPRGSQRPGTYFLYNNWDFNAAGTVFEKLTGQDIYDAVERDLARPLGMQDFDRARQQKRGDASRSRHMAYHMWLSTRDMARLGLLMLREGDWGGRRLVPREWIRRITSLVTPHREMNPPSLRALGQPTRWGYGYMWWVWDAPNSEGPFRGAYTAMGARGQYITVLPERDLVVAHKTDPAQPSPHRQGEQGRSVSAAEYFAALNLLISARCPGPCR